MSAPPAGSPTVASGGLRASRPGILYVCTVSITTRAFLLPFAARFRSLGWRVDAMANGISRCSDCTAGFEHVYEAPWARNPASPRNLLAVRRIREIVQAGGYDLVHVHTPVAGFIARLALHKLRSRSSLRVVYTAHGFHFHSLRNRLANALLIRLEKIGGARADAIIVINGEDHANAMRHGIATREQLLHFPGIGVDTGHFRREAVAAERLNQLRQELKLPPGAACFLMIAEFNPGKRHRDVLHALTHIGHPDCVVVFAGVGKLLEQTQELARSLGVLSRTRFVGFQKTVRDYLALSDCLLLPSEREGLPRSIMEAMAMEVMVIGTNIRGIRDLVDRETGILCEIGDPRQLAQAMQWVIENRPGAKQMGINARAKVQPYGLEVLLKKHEELYHRLLAGRRQAVLVRT